MSTTTKVNDSSGKKVSIPGGFKVSTESANNVSDGIVIEDSNGNQFVWIPVSQASDFAQNFNYPYFTPYVQSFYDNDDGYPVGIYGIEKLIEYGGYYVSRFEVSFNNGIYSSRRGLSRILGSERNRNVLVNGLRNSFINTKYAKTSLISGAAYDTMLKFVNNKRFNSGQIYNVTSKMPSSAAHANSGSSEADKVCNIYDLAGGMECITAEIVDVKYDGAKPVLRKGMTESGNEMTPYCPSYRVNYTGITFDSGSYYLSARATLYVFGL